MENPLISPCNCSGSMKYIHYGCLKKCIEANLTKKIEQNYKYYNWRNYSCEICQKEYPKYFKAKDIIYPLIDLDINYSSYIICDYSSFDDVKKKTTRKGILIFKMDEDKDENIITIGRSQTNNVKLKDITVSRFHCKIIRKKTNLFIEDNGSKFGTLLYINKPLNINLKNTEQFIISGRHWFSIKLEENKSFFSKYFSLNCCQCNEIKNFTNIDVEHLDDKIIEKQNEKTNIEVNNDVGKNIECMIFDQSYQDYILDLGDDIYLNEQSESIEKI
jgi:hypothetical protein